MTKKLEGYVLKPFYILKIGDLVRVKDFEQKLKGQVGLIVSREEFGVASEVVFSDGTRRTMMNFTLERVDG
jgi:hypothetical protein